MPASSLFSAMQLIVVRFVVIVVVVRVPADAVGSGKGAKGKGTARRAAAAAATEAAAGELRGRATFDCDMRTKADYARVF